MHGYSNDSWIRQPIAYFGLAMVSILVTPLIGPWLVQWGLSTAIVPPVAAFTVYGVLLIAVEHAGWRWSRAIPNLAGTWRGRVSSSHANTEVEVVVRIRQSWHRLRIELEAPESQSRSCMASLFADQPGDAGLRYEFLTEPKNAAVSSMQMARGLASLRWDEGLCSLNGPYFTGRGRVTQGDIALEKVSTKQLSFDDAMRSSRL